MSLCDHHGVQIFWDQQGSGDPVLLLMGLGSDHLLWDRQVEPFAARHRVVLMDNRGVGRSAKPPGPYTVREMAEDARTVLDAAGVGRAHVVGISMGGMIAQELAIAYPERIGALVLAATYARPDEASRKITDAVAAEAGAGDALQLLADASEGRLPDLSKVDMLALFRALIRRVLTAEFLAREGAYLAGLFQRAMAASDPQLAVQGFFAQVAAVLSHDTHERLGAITAPTLVLTGTDDALVPPHHSQELARLIQGASLVELPGGVHGFNLETPEAFNKVVLEFLAGHRLS